MSSTKGNINLEEYEEYTDKEVEHIDRYKKLTGQTMEDEEIYEIIIKNNFDDKKIRNEILEYTQLLKKKGEDYNWTVVEKGKSKIYFLNLEQKPVQKIEEAPIEYEKKYQKNYETKPKYERYQDQNYEQQYDRYQDQNYDNQYSFNKRGQRGARRGNYRGGRARGGNRRPFEEYIDNKASVVENVVTQNDNNTDVGDSLQNKNVHVGEDLNVNSQNENVKIDAQKEVLVKENIPSPTNKNKSPKQSHPVQVQNNQSIFTIERENDAMLSKLLEINKPETPQNKEKDLKIFLEECQNHFVRNNQINSSSFAIKPVVKPNKITQQPQLSYNQSTTSTNSSSTNKNFPQKTFNQQQQQPQSNVPQQEYMNYQQQMYPFMMYPQTNSDPNVPSQYPQMMNQPMFYMMNPYMVLYLFIFSINSSRNWKI